MKTNHSEQSSVLETRVELHQSRLSSRFSLHKTTKERNTRNTQHMQLENTAEAICCKIQYVYSNYTNMKRDHTWRYKPWQKFKNGVGSCLEHGYDCRSVCCLGVTWKIRGNIDWDYLSKLLVEMTQLWYWLDSSRKVKWERPLRSTASLSPRGSQAKDWISPPTLASDQIRQTHRMK